jgi:hypothetical protein
MKQFEADKFVLPREGLMQGQKTLDRLSQKAISKSLERGTQSDEEYLAELLPTGAQGTAPKVGSAGMYSAGGEDPTADALQKRANREFDTSAGRQRRLLGLENVLRRSNDLSRTASNLGQYENIKLQNLQARTQNAETLRQIRLQEDQARAGILGSILGLAGGALGGIIGAASAATPLLNVKSPSQSNGSGSTPTQPVQPLQA